MTYAEFIETHYAPHPKCLMDETRCKYCYKTPMDRIFKCSVNITGDVEIGDETCARAWYCAEWKDLMEDDNEN